MYINPVVAGILGTLLVEMAIVIVISLFKGDKK